MGNQHSIIKLWSNFWEEETVMLSHALLTTAVGTLRVTVLRVWLMTVYI